MHMAHMRDVSNAYKILVGKLKGIDQTEDLNVDGDNIRMDLREVG